MNGIVYLDGGEHTGKSTLAAHLAERCGALVIHHGYRFKDQMFAYHAAGLRRAIEASASRLVVIDRHWMSEAVYGHVYRGGTRWPQEGRMMDRMLRRFGAYTVICATDPDHAAGVARSHPGRDLYKSEAQARECMRHWIGLARGEVTDAGNYFFSRQVYRSMGAPDEVGLYDYRYWNVADFAGSMLERLAHVRDRIPPDALNPKIMNLAGRLPHPDDLTTTTLMVGEACNPKNSKVAWPFFEYGNSSLFLAKAMDAYGIPEDRLAWTNCRDTHFDLVLRLFAAAGGDSYVAIGRTAAEALVARGIRRFGEVRHPQFVRRFDSKNLYGYGEEIALALSTT